MRTLAVLALVATVLLIAGIVVVTALSSSPAQEQSESYEYNSASCSSGCGNSCTLESNCGLSTCGAVSGGSCGCS